MSKIVKRKYYALEVQLQSPLSVSSGLDYYTDSDVIRDKAGRAFMPGSSIAGALRHNLKIKSPADEEKAFVGYADEKDGKMSSLFISDLYLSEDNISVRDGIALDDDKQVIKENKFDFEIVETGARGTMYFEIVIRDEKEEALFDKNMDRLFQEIQNGSIRFGANKNRGLGRLHIGKIHEMEFSADSVNEWLAFVPHCKEISFYEKEYTFDEWKENHETVDSAYLRIRVPLKLKGGISIRKYSTAASKADFQHITCDGKPVIPGSSWNGAIRSDIKNILTELNVKPAKMESLLNKWFGYVNPAKKNANQSMIVIGESIIEGAKKQIMTRNKINRFDTSTKQGALYTEEAFFGGETELEFLILKDENHDYLAAAAILLLVISDIQKGYVAVGGQTAVGRGIFEANGEISGIENVNIEECNQLLYESLFKL